MGDHETRVQAAPYQRPINRSPVSVTSTREMRNPFLKKLCNVHRMTNQIHRASRQPSLNKLGQRLGSLLHMPHKIEKMEKCDKKFHLLHRIMSAHYGSGRFISWEWVRTSMLAQEGTLATWTSTPLCKIGIHLYFSFLFF